MWADCVGGLGFWGRRRQGQGLCPEHHLHALWLEVLEWAWHWCCYLRLTWRRGAWGLMRVGGGRRGVRAGLSALSGAAPAACAGGEALGRAAVPFALLRLMALLLLPPRPCSGF